MKRATLALACWLALASLACADIGFEGAARVPANTIAEVRPSSPDYKSFIVKITSVADGKKVVTKKGQAGWIYFTGKPGEYLVTATAGKVDKDGNLLLEDAEFTITIGDAPPVPPGPTPVPPGPTPGPDDAPIKAPGFRVLIVYETSKSLPAKQMLIIESTAMRTLLKKTCVTDKDNPNGAWKMWDPDVDTGNVPKDWADAMKRPRKSVPWVIVSNGTTGYEGPLPDDVDAMTALLAKYSPKGGK